MPSTSALFGALASALVGLHQSGWLDRVPVYQPAEAPTRPCRLFADDRRGAVEEGLLLLSASPYAGWVCLVIVLFAIVGVLTTLHCVLDFCCVPRAPRSVHRVLSHGAGADRQIARR